MRQTKRRLRVALAQAAVHFVEADEIEPGTAQVFDHAGEETRRHLEQPVGLELVGPPRAHVMQGQDRPDPAQHRAQRAVGAGEIQRLQPAANDRLLQSGHGRSPYRCQDYPNLLLIILCQG